MSVSFATCSYPEFRPEMGTPVRATIGYPRFNLGYVLGGTMSEAAPSRSFFDLPYSDFCTAMHAKLDKVGITEFVRIAQRIADNLGRPDATIVLLCFENSRNRKGWCHRRVVADWLAGHGYDCPEVGTLSPDDPGAGALTLPEPDEEPATIEPTGGNAAPVVASSSRLTVAERRAAHRIAEAGPQPSTPPATDRPDCDETIRTVIAVAATVLRGSALEGVCTCGGTHWAKAMDGPYPRRRRVELGRILRGWGYVLAGPWKGQQAPVARIEETPVVLTEPEPSAGQESGTPLPQAPDPEPVGVLEEVVDSTVPASEPDPGMQVVAAVNALSVPVALIDRDPGQPREVFDETKMYELRESMKAHGLLTPIAVRPGEGGRYVIVAGERRWRAAQDIGMTHVTAVLRDGVESDEDRLASYMASMAENINRADMNDIEEGKAYARLVDEFGKSWEQIAEAFGKTTWHVELRLRFLKLTPEAQEALIKGHIGRDYATYLTPLNADNQSVALARYVRGDFTDTRAAVAFVQALAAAESAGPGFFEMGQEAGLSDDEKAEKAREKKKARAQIDDAERATALLQELASKTPTELAELFAGEVRSQIDKLDRLNKAVNAAKLKMRKALGVSEARTYAVRAEVAA